MSSFWFISCLQVCLVGGAPLTSPVKHLDVPHKESMVPTHEPIHIVDYSEVCGFLWENPIKLGKFYVIKRLHSLSSNSSYGDI